MTNPPRVRVADYGRLERDDPRLVSVPSTPGRQCRLHWAAAAVVRALMDEWYDGRRAPLLVCSGWREHRWASREQYEGTLISRYGSVERGRVYLAYDSPHETGLALDWGSAGLWPDSRMVLAQRATVVFSWLRDHAPPRDLHNYQPEPWHWEALISREVWDAPGPEAPPP